MLLDGIRWNYRRIEDDWTSKNPLVSQTTPSTPPPWFWHFYSSYSRPPSRFGSPMCIDHVHMILDGVIRPGMYKSTYLIPWPHTFPPPSIPFTPGALQMLSPLYTIYIHTSPTFLHLSMDWIPLAHHLSSPFPPSLFSVPQASWRQTMHIYTFPHVYTIIPCFNGVPLTAFPCSTKPFSLCWIIFRNTYVQHVLKPSKAK